MARPSPLATTRARATPIATGGYSPAAVEGATIMSVNALEYSVDFVTDFNYRFYGGVPFASPYVHHQYGEGVYAMPEVGAKCWVCWPSDGQHPFILGYGAALDRDGAAWRGNRKAMGGGDIYLGTRDGNGVTIRRGGVVEVQATPIAKRFYIPINNLIRDFCQNYELRTFGGDLTWLVERPEKNEAGDKTTTLLIQAKEKATDPGVVMRLTTGYHAGEETALKLQIYSDGTDAQQLKATLQIDKQGNVGWTVTNKFSVAADGEIDLSAKANASLRSEQQATLSGQTGVMIESTGGSISIVAQGDINIGSNDGSKGLVVDAAGNVYLGGKGGESLIKGATAHTWMASHTQPVAGTTATAPASPPPASMLSNKVFVK